MPQTRRLPPPPTGLDGAQRFYRDQLLALADSGVPFLVGGGYAFSFHTGIYRTTKDFDVFVREEDLAGLVAVLERAGTAVELFAPHWLAKARRGDHWMDVIHSSGNGIARVDDLWFEHAPAAEVLGIPVRLCPVEETIWSKAFIMERERYDGADVLHLLHQQATKLDWPRLMARFGGHWRVLLAHLTLFGFVYPQRVPAVPDWVMAELTRRLRREQRRTPPRMAVCRGALLSRTQFAVDVEEWGYRDGRLPPDGRMTRADIAHWERLRRQDEKRKTAGGHRPRVRNLAADDGELDEPFVDAPPRRPVRAS